MERLTEWNDEQTRHAYYPQLRADESNQRIQRH